MAAAADISGSRGGGRMSLEVASRLFDWSSIALAIGACIVFVATAAIVWLGIVKEHHWDVLREQANAKIASVELDAAKSNAEAAKAHERIAELSTQAEQLRKDAAEANAKLGATQADIARANASIAEANARTKEAELKLEQLRKELGPRQLQREVLIKELAGQPTANVEIMYLQDDPECFSLAQQIGLALNDAAWPTASPKPIPSLFLSDGPTSMSVDGQPSGVTVVVRGITQEEVDASTNAFMGRDWVKTPWTVLSHALGAALGKISSHAGGPNAPEQGTLRIVVAPRM